MNWIILPAVILLGGLVLGWAARQDKNAKNRFRQIFLALVLGALISGFFNWETFVGFGRSGFVLARQYPQSFLSVFFFVAFIQFILLLLRRRFADVVAAVLSFANTVIFFMGLIRLAGKLGFQPVSYANMVALFVVLICNVVGLMLINKDNNLLAKFPWSTQYVVSAKKSKTKPVSGWIVWSIFLATVVLMIWLFIQGMYGGEQRAISEVKRLPEVQSFLRDVPGGKVDVGSDDEFYMVHVYEVRDGHTATFNWYRVDKDDYLVEQEF